MGHGIGNIYIAYFSYFKHIRQCTASQDDVYYNTALCSRGQCTIQIGNKARSGVFIWSSFDLIDSEYVALEMCFERIKI